MKRDFAMKVIAGPDVLEDFQRRMALLKQGHATASALVMRWQPEAEAPWLADQGTLQVLAQHTAKALDGRHEHAAMLAMPCGDLLMLGEGFSHDTLQQAAAALEVAAATQGVTPLDAPCAAHLLESDWDQFVEICDAMAVRSEAALHPEAQQIDPDKLAEQLDAELARYGHAFGKRGKRPMRLELLFVEDDAAIRQLLHTVLASTPHNLRFAANARDAVYAYCHTPPHMVFLDINLPDLSGLRLLEILMRHDSGAHTVMLTSHSGSAEVQAALRSGVKHYVVKPFNRQKLGECLARYMVA